MLSEILFGVLFVFLIVSLLFALHVVGESEVLLVERCGRFVASITTPGIHVLLPWDRVVFRKSRRSLLLDTEPIQCWTRDRVKVTVDTYVYYRIVNAQQAYYEVDDYEEALRLAVESRLVDAVGKLNVHAIDNATLEEALGKLHRDRDIGRWGIELGETKIQNITLPDSLGEATQKQVTERHRATVEQQRMEAELALEKQKLAAEREKEMMQLELEQQRLKARVEHEKLQQQKVSVAKNAQYERLEKLKKAGLLDSYIELERQNMWTGIFQCLDSPTTFFFGSPSETPPLALHLPMPQAPDVRQRRRQRRASTGRAEAESAEDE